MPISRRRLSATAAVAATAALARPFIGRARAADPIRLRCSLDTAPSHMRNVSMGDYLKKLEAASGALFADVNVTKALVQGQVEMACPGTWTMTGFVPDFDFVNLPELYAQPADIVHKAIDGKTGLYLAEQLKNKLRLRVLGPWLDLGFEHWYATSRPLRTLADIKGLKVRNAGGAALAWRTRFFEAIPNTTAWPDVPLALSQGTFDGVITTNESASSSKLWEAGLKYSLQDHQNVNEYVPMVSDAFYSSLPADLQTKLIDLWHENIPTYRTNMMAAQDKALATLKEHGVQVVVADEAELAAARKRMLPEQDKLIRDLHMTADLPKHMQEDIGNSV
jgi:C4-dicarboxylate-binding protein DctP